MRAYVHCCIAVHPYFTEKPRHVTLTNRIPGLGSHHACVSGTRHQLFVPPLVPKEVP